MPIYMGVVIQQQPSRALDLLAYASLVVHAARKYKGEGWSTISVKGRQRTQENTGES